MSTFNSNFIIEESKKKDKSPSTNKLVLDIIKTSNSKEEMVRKLKEIDKNGGGTGWKDPGYMKHDIFNALISCCLGVPSGFAAAAMTPLGLAGVPVGLLGLYLTGQVFHIKATKYDKFHLLEYYEKKMKSKKKILEKALDKEKDPKVRAEIQNRIKEADKCIKACDKERRKLLPPKVASKAEEFDDLDDFDFDFDDDWDNWEDIEIDESTLLEYSSLSFSNFLLSLFSSPNDIGSSIGKSISKSIVGDEKYNEINKNYDIGKKEIEKRLEKRDKKITDLKHDIANKKKQNTEYDSYSKLPTNGKKIIDNNKKEIDDLKSDINKFINSVCKKAYSKYSNKYSKITKYIDENDKIETGYEYNTEKDIWIISFFSNIYSYDYNNDDNKMNKEELNECDNFIGEIYDYCYEYCKKNSINNIEVDINCGNFIIYATKQFKNIINETTLLESKISKSRCNPVYIITMEGKSFISKPIKTFTHSEFSHAGLSLTPDLSKIFSFNMRLDTSVSGERKGGISLESIDGYNKDNPTGRLRVNAVFLKNKDFKILKDKLDYMVQNAVDTSYNVIGLFDVVINKAVETGDNMSMVCSQFVDYMFKLINVDLTSKSSNLVAPSDIAKIENPKVYKLFDGIINEFKPSIIKNKLNKLYNKAEYIKESDIMSESLIEPIFESKKNFDIKFSEEGDLIISKRDKLDIEEEHAKSKRLYPIYKKNNNLEAMKYEAAKLYYMNSLITHKLNGMNHKRMSKQREELITLRSKVLNEYSLYIRYITSKEADFNFTSYYRNSPFCTAEMKITKRTLKNILDSILLITSVF